jgi:hypothetical protein
MSDPRGAGPTVPRRAYVFIVLGGTVLGSVISLALGVYYLITQATGATVVGSGANASEALATFVVLGVTAAYYFFVLQRDQRVLSIHHAATQTIATPTELSPGLPTERPSLESVLQQVAAGQLDVGQAATMLREQFGAKG